MERKQNPRVPKMSLEEAVALGDKLYDGVQDHSIGLDVAAQELGYKDANNGTARTVLGTLKYFGVIENIGAGCVAISQQYKVFRFSPNPKEKLAVLNNFLSTPEIYYKLLAKYGLNLPTVNAIVWDLMQLGFISENAANKAADRFIQSIKYLKNYQSSLNIKPENDDNIDDKTKPYSKNNQPDNSVPDEAFEQGYDKIPIRLPEGRKAWLIVPENFKAKDKPVIIKQIEAIYVEEE